MEPRAVYSHSSPVSKSSMHRCISRARLTLWHPLKSTTVPEGIGAYVHNYGQASCISYLTALVQGMCLQNSALSRVKPRQHACAT